MLIAFFAIIYKPLNLQQPCHEPKVRDSECLVNYGKQVSNIVDLFSFLIRQVLRAQKRPDLCLRGPKHTFRAR